MSALGSSVINKSGKKFALKAPVRRATRPTSTQNTSRASVDRQNLSQTPQPQPQIAVPPQAESHQQLQNAQHHVPIFPTLPASQSALLSSQKSSLTAPASEVHQDTPTSTSVPSNPTEPISQAVASEVQSPLQTNPRKRILEANSVSKPQERSQSLGDGEARVQPDSKVTGNQDLLSNTLSASHHPYPTLDVLISASSPSQPERSSLTTRPDGSDNSQPSPKRRKVQQQTTQPRPSISPDGDIVVPFTETGGEVNVIRSHIETQPSATQPATARLTAKSSKRRIIAKAKKKSRVEMIASNVAVSAPQGSSIRAGKGNRALNPTMPRKKASGTQGNLEVENAAAEVVADAVQGTSDKKKAIRRRTRRAPTPEGAEEVRIIPSKVKMSELCKDISTGKKSAREKELARLAEEEQTRKNQKQLQELMGIEETPSQATESADQRLERLAREKDGGEDGGPAVPNTIIVDGQIQIDETTLQLDRHANAAVERAAEQLEGVDESELSRRVTQSTWGKRDKSGGWNEESTELFYDGLRMFGTDFEIISKMLPGRTRHSVKLKFGREEKLNREGIKRILMGERIPVDLDEYSRLSGTVFADPRALERELEEDRMRMEREQAAEKEAMDELIRQREAGAAAEGAAVGDDSFAKENQDGSATKGTKGKKVKEKGKKAGRSRKGTRNSVQEEVLGDESTRQEGVVA